MLPVPPIHVCFMKSMVQQVEIVREQLRVEVELVPYDADTLDTTVLWTTSKDLGDGFRGIRTVKNIRLHLDAFHGDQRSGGVRDGTTIVLWDWNKGDNQRWKIIPC